MNKIFQKDYNISFIYNIIEKKTKIKKMGGGSSKYQDIYENPDISDKSYS